MFHKRHDELKRLGREVGLGLYDFSVILNEPAGTVGARLNGYLPLSEKQRTEILNAISFKHKKKDAKQSDYSAK